MTQQDSGRDRLGRRAKRFLSPSQKYELWLQLVTGELSQSEAAERFGIDRSTVMRIRQVAKQGALEALAASKPGMRQAPEDAELAAARAAIQRPGEAVTEQAIEPMLLRGTSRWAGRRRPPARGSRRQARAAGAGRPGGHRGFTAQAACRVLQVTQRRVNRWQARRAAGTLADRSAGGGAVHGLLEEEAEQILELAAEWGELDRSHRKLAHRGARLGRVGVSPASVFRVLAAHDLVLPKPRAAGPVQRRPWPDWVEYRPNQVWGWDVERHEALPDRVVVKGHRRRPVAAGRLKLRAA
jgi:transposase-like protein